jgi:hypothetical protein
VVLLLAGDFVSSDLERAAALASHDGIRRLPYLPERDFCWPPRLPTPSTVLSGRRRDSGIGVRFMGIGKPVMVTEARKRPVSQARASNRSGLRKPPH